MKLIDIDQDVKEILSLLQKNKYLAAHELYLSLAEQVKQVQEFLSGEPSAESSVDEDSSSIDNKLPSHSNEELESWLARAQQWLSTHQEQLHQMDLRMADIHACLNYQDHDEQWILGASHFGINTYYQLDHSDGSMIIKMEGHLELPLFEQCAVIYEIDLFNTWIPFCSDSQLVDKLGPAELIAYMNIGINPLSRDCCIHCYAADCLHEHSKILIIGKSLEEYAAKPLPLKTSGWFHKQMTIKEFKVISELQSPTTAKSTIIAHINPNTPLPQALLNIIMKNLAGLVLYMFQKQAHRVCADINCEHAQRMQKNKEFYIDWVLPKFRDFCDFKGWEQPAVPALGEYGVVPPKTC